MDLILKYYTFLFTAMLLLSLITKLTMKFRGTYDKTPKAVQVEEMLLMPVMAIGLIGCYGYLYQFGLVGQVYWKIYAALFVLISVVSFWMPKLKWMRAELEPKKFVLIYLVASAMNAPFIFMLLLYAYFKYPAA